MRRTHLAIKRAIDIFGAGAGLLLLAPVIVSVAALIRWRLGRPVFFMQVRPGYKGRLFKLVKFRTMRDARDAEGNLLPDDQRLTPLGRFLRHWSLDELPELWNVLRGDMSLVGPRPLLVEYLPRYTPRQAKRHDMRPGITGLAQIMGRNAIPFSRRIAWDLYYVEHFSIWLDLKILWMTVFRVSSGTLYDGAGQDVRVVDDLGLHPGHETWTRILSERATRGERIEPDEWKRLAERPVARDGVGDSKSLEPSVASEERRWRKSA
ncbi:MAG: sugar transferase [Planctomycetota bacterium]|nr:MAG: sugar transferase [Planctomycetota bacterium]